MSTFGQEAYVVDEVNGVWSQPVDVAYAPNLNAGGFATVSAISCSSPGNCAAGGTFLDLFSHFQPFVATEVDGTWKLAKALVANFGFRAGSGAALQGISCPSDGNCTAVGYFENSSGSNLHFVADEVDGSWGTANTLAWGAIDGGIQGAVPNAVSCWSAGNCAVGGYYIDGNGKNRPFIASEIAGKWSNLEELPGYSGLTGVTSGEIDQVSCGADGSCGAVGGYQTATKIGGLADTGVGGAWANATTIEPPTIPSSSFDLQLDEISCSAGANCTAVGTVLTNSGADSVAVSVEAKGGVWSVSTEVPGSSSLVPSGTMHPTSISCWAAGACTVVGWYQSGVAISKAMVVEELGGVWSDVVEAPETALIGIGPVSQNRFNAVSCSSGGFCGAAGQYANLNGQLGALVETRAIAPQAPSSAIAVAGNGSIAVSWSPTSFENNLADSGYQATATLGASIRVCNQPTTATSCTINGLSNGSNYAVKVVAHNIVGDSPAVSAGIVQPFTVPGPVRALHVVPGQGRVTFAWITPSSNGGRQVLSYRVTSNPGLGSCTTKATTCTISNLSPSTAYTFSVAASNLAGPGASKVESQVFPFMPKGFGLETPSLVLPHGSTEVVIAGGGKAGVSTTIWDAQGPKVSCKLSFVGQCAVTFRSPSYGVHHVVSQSGPSTAALSFYIPLVQAPATVAHGSRAKFTVTACPSGSIVRLSTSDGRSFATAAGATGSAAFSVSMPKLEIITVTLRVAGVTVRPPFQLLVH